MKRTPLKRHKQLQAKCDSLKRRNRMRQMRSKPRRGELTREQKEEVRRIVYERDGHCCQVQKHPLCTKERELPWDGSIYERFHMAHLHAKRRFGTRPGDCIGACYWCHIVVMHTYGADGQKPCPPKPEGSRRDYVPAEAGA